MDEFLALIREQRGQKGQTVFLLVEWSLTAEAHSTVLERLHAMAAEAEARPEGKRPSVPEQLSAVWKEFEPAYKSSQNSNKFNVTLQEEVIAEGSGPVGGAAAWTGEGGSGESEADGGSRYGSHMRETGADPAAEASGSGSGAPFFSPNKASKPLVGILRNSSSGSSRPEPGSVGADAPRPAEGGLTASAGSSGSAITEAEGRAMRSRVVELDRLGLQVRHPLAARTHTHALTPPPPLQAVAERQALGRALEMKEAALQDALARLAALDAEERDSKTMAGGVRRRVAAATSASPSKPTAAEEEDDDTVTGKEGDGFPLWQIVLVAILAFLLGRLSITGLPQ